MAQPMQCDTQCGTLASILVTMVETGDVQAYCAPCYLDIATELLGQTGRMAQIIDAAITAAVGGDGPAPEPAKPARKGAAKKAAAPVQDTGPAGESTPAQVHDQAV